MIKLKDNRVCKLLGIDYPVLSAPMSWTTDARLVAAVSEAGGFGILGPNAGQTELTSDIMEAKERMRREIAKTRELTKKPFGAELLWVGSNNAVADALLDLYCEDEELTAILCLENVPQEAVDRLHAAGKICIHKMMHASIAGIQKAKNMGYDAVVVGGVDAGGHVSRKKIGTFTAIRMAKEVTDLPLIAAGGIIDGISVHAAGLFGAEGVYCGTRFCASVEAPLANNVKKKMCEMNVDDCLQVDGLFGPILCLATPDIVKSYELYEESHKNNAAAITGTYAGGYRTGMVLGGIDEGVGLLDVSASIGQIKEILTCQQIMDEFKKGME